MGLPHDQETKCSGTYEEAPCISCRNFWPCTVALCLHIYIQHFKRVNKRLELLYRVHLQQPWSYNADCSLMSSLVESNHCRYAKAVLILHVHYYYRFVLHGHNDLGRTFYNLWDKLRAIFETMFIIKWVPTFRTLCISVLN